MIVSKAYCGLRQTVNSCFTKTAGGMIKAVVDIAFQCPVGVFHLPAYRLIGSKQGYFFFQGL